MRDFKGKIIENPDGTKRFLLESKNGFSAFIENQRVGKYVLRFLLDRTKHRTNPQNSYYWGVVVETIAEETGNTPRDVHDGLKHLFLIDEQQPSPLPKIRSTTDLSTVEMEEYLAKVRSWASVTLHIFIPEPNEEDTQYFQ